MPTFPAVAVGGPPHSGKSVLTYSLTQALRAQHIDHYVLRACPDGEGDWTQETPPDTVRLLRNKGQFTETFVAQVSRTLQARHLPLLVDMGGRPTAEQEVLFDHCTHALLLAPTAAALAQWRALAQRHNLTILAELQSTLTEPEAIESAYPILRGRIAGLARQQLAQGPIVEQLASLLRTLFSQSAADLRQAHLAAAPAEITVDLTRLARTLGVAPNGVWQPADLPAVLAYLPERVPLAIYGRGPNWLYAALAAFAAPAPFYQFDARLGWVTPLRCQGTARGLSSPVQVHWTEQGDYLRLQAHIPATYLDYSETLALPMPPLPTGQGLILDGKLPHWLLTSFLLAYPTAAWRAVYQPPLQAAVVVASRSPAYPIGRILTIGQ